MKRGRKYRLTGRRKQHFLEVLAECGNVTAAAAAAGVARCVPYEHRKADDAFAKGWEEAEEIAADRLEAEAWRRGVEEPVIGLGKVVEERTARRRLLSTYRALMAPRGRL